MYGFIFNGVSIVDVWILILMWCKKMVDVVWVLVLWLICFYLVGCGDGVWSMFDNSCL